mgnify:CR=1 FL=1
MSDPQPQRFSFEQIWQMFCSEMKASGLDCEKYRNDEDVQNELMTVTRARSEGEARTLVKELVTSIAKQVQETQVKRAPSAPAAPPSPLTGRAYRGRVFVAPSSIPISMIRTALVVGGLAAGYGSAEIAAITDRLKAIADLMRECMMMNGEPYEQCVSATQFAGDVLDDRAHEIALHGLKYLTEKAGTFQASLKSHAIIRFESLRHTDRKSVV